MTTRDTIVAAMDELVRTQGWAATTMTDVAGLSVLPVGTEGGQNASSFSPSAVRRLIAAVRDQFDMVLIDTGPVLGSIEATPVVAASDAVILQRLRALWARADLKVIARPPPATAPGLVSDSGGTGP